MDLDLSAANLAFGLLFYLVFCFSITCHEAAHAWAASRLGDSTAYHAGQVSLSPLPHMRREPFGMVLMPILTFLLSGFMLGWASAPYDPQWALRHPKRGALMALAGPVANFILAGLAAIAIRIGLSSGAFGYFPGTRFGEFLAAAPGSLFEPLGSALGIAFALNLLLGIFNLIPVPPLDGSGVIQLAMPDELARRYQTLLYEQPLLAWAGLLLAWKLSGPVLGFFYNLGVHLLVRT